MLIEIDKYQPNSLRKVRIDALEKDFSDAFTLFSNKFYDPRSITINDFLLFWTSSQLRFIIYIRCEDQDQNEFFQAIDKILINEYFLKDSDEKKIYALLCLYFFCYWVDGNGDRNPRLIHVTPEFIQILSAFLRRNTEYSRSLFLKVVKRIKDLFVYTIKTGFRDPLIKKNGQTYIRYPKPLKKLTRDNYSPTVIFGGCRFWRLNRCYLVYRNQLERINRANKEDVQNNKKQLMAFDKNTTLRLNQILKSYDAEVTYMEQDFRINDEE